MYFSFLYIATVKKRKVPKEKKPTPLLGRSHLRWLAGFVLANSLRSDTLRTQFPSGMMFRLHPQH